MLKPQGPKPFYFFVNMLTKLEVLCDTDTGYSFWIGVLGRYSMLILALFGAVILLGLFYSFAV